MNKLAKKPLSLSNNRPYFIWLAIWPKMRKFWEAGYTHNTPYPFPPSLYPSPPNIADLDTSRTLP